MTLTCTLGSSVPFLLMHLPPPPPISPHSLRVQATFGEVGSVLWNPLLWCARSSSRGNLMFDGKVIWEVVGGLRCGAVTKECRTGRQIHSGSVSMPLRL
ncbi:hypothetical protein BDR03DRAFT_966024, partial [Suillus americanus]